MISISTSKGPLNIQLFEQQTNTVSQFRHLVESDAWAGCSFDHVSEEYVRLQPAKLSVEWKSERHSRLSFDRRGTVALCRDLSLVFTIQPRDPGVECNLVGLLDEPSIWAIRRLSQGETENGIPRFKTEVLRTHAGPCHAGRQGDGHDEQQSGAPCEPQTKRLRIFENPGIKKLKENPKFKDAMFVQLERFESRLDAKNCHKHAKLGVSEPNIDT